MTERAPLSRGRGAPRERLHLVQLILLSVVALVARLYATRTVGFGDSEALYASYALFPAPAYLDHPGLIGLLARALGHGVAPSPSAAHAFTTAAATIAPWAVVAACRLLGSRWGASIAAGIAVAVAPEIAVGLFGMTPDLPLFFAWLAALAFFGRALYAAPGSVRASMSFLASGVALGIGCASKASAFTLAIAFLVVLARPAARGHARTVWPWLGFALAAVIVSPVVLYEAHTGWPMLRHRLVATQHDAGVSLRNAAAIVFGQVVYVSPILFACGVALGVELFATRSRDIVRTLLAAATFAPLACLGSLCLWSRVAEPHWLAPAWLSLPLYFAHRATHPPDADATVNDSRVRRWARAALRASVQRGAVVVALAASAFVYAWVLVPGVVALVPRSAYDPKADIANELYGWSDAAADVDRIAALERNRFAEASITNSVVVVGSVWMVCAQLRAALPVTTAVGCTGDNVADFASWAPRARWAGADVVVFVHDNRAPADAASLFPDRAPVATYTRTILRGGHVARVFTFEVLSRRAAG